jgi:hypothetical protein
VTELNLVDYYQKRFFLRKYANISHAELFELAPYEMDIEWNLLLSEFKKKGN